MRAAKYTGCLEGTWEAPGSLGFTALPRRCTYFPLFSSPITLGRVRQPRILEIDHRPFYLGHLDEWVDRGFTVG